MDLGSWVSVTGAVMIGTEAGHAMEGSAAKYADLILMPPTFSCPQIQMALSSYTLSSGAGDRRGEHRRDPRPAAGVGGPRHRDTAGSGRHSQLEYGAPKPKTPHHRFRNVDWAGNQEHGKIIGYPQVGQDMPSLETPAC